MVTGMLLALHVVLAVFVSLPLTESVRISISFVTTVVTGYLFGPWMALTAGALGDILQFIIKPTGTYFFGWTLNAALAGMLYGLAFYHRAPGITEKKKVDFKKWDWITAAVMLLLLICWFTLPFLTLTEKGTGELVAEGSAFSLLTQGRGGSTAVIAAAALVLMIVEIICSLLQKRVLGMLASVAACLWLLLPVYSDRKVLEAGTGFYLIAAGFFLCIFLQIILVLWQNSLDGKYLLRCVLAMAVSAIVIQMLLGTYWCVVMYGKGYWFYFVPRAVKSMIQLPFNSVLAYYVVRAIHQLKLDLPQGAVYAKQK